MEKSFAHRLLTTAVVLVAIAAMFLSCSLSDANGTPRGGDNGRVSRWDSAMRLLSAPSGCRKTEMKIEGGNAVVPDVIEAHLVIPWCWNLNGNSPNSFTSFGPPNQWSRASWAWSSEGVSDIVSGSGTVPDTNGQVHYRYRRYYWRFTRLFQGVFGQSTPWIAITVRDNGTCTMAKYGSGQISCDQAAGGGGGGGW